jgi:hypothetical protein
MGGNLEKSETGVFDGLIGPKYEVQIVLLTRGPQVNSVLDGRPYSSTL